MWPQSLCSHRCASQVHGSHSPCEVNMAGQRKLDDGPFAFLLLAGDAWNHHCPPLHIVCSYLMEFTQDLTAAILAMLTIFINNRKDTWILFSPMYQTRCNRKAEPTPIVLREFNIGIRLKKYLMNEGHESNPWITKRATAESRYHSQCWWTEGTEAVRG